jgi:hypothetical protein
VLERSLSIQDEQYRAEALVALVGQCPEILSDTIQAVEAAGNEDAREALIKQLRWVFPRVFQALLRDQTTSPVASFTNWLENLPEFYRLKALCILADQLPSDLLPPALQAILTIHQYKWEHIDALIALADKFPEAFRYALQFAQEECNGEFRTKALIALAKKCPSAFPLALQSALALTIKANANVVSATLAGYESYDRVDALRDLAQEFPEVLAQALQSAQEIKDRRKRFEALFALAKIFPEVLPKALNAAPFQALEALAPYLAQISTPELANFWQQALRVSCLGTRQDLLQDITALAPVISVLGNSTGSKRVVSSIQRVCRWWV